MGYTKPVRVWREVAELLDMLSEEYGYMKSDLASAILIEAFRNPHLIAFTLKEWFEIDWEEALETALEISSRMLRKPIGEEEEESQGIEIGIN